MRPVFGAAVGTGGRGALHIRQRRPCGDRLVEVLVVLAGAPEPKLGGIAHGTVRATHGLHGGH
jgi:hypothetical protein